VGGLAVATAGLEHQGAAATGARFGSDAWRAWLLVYTALWGFTLGTAILVWALPCGPAIAREVLRLTLSGAHNPPPSLAGVSSIAANNILHSVWPLSLGLIGAQRRRSARLLADAAVLANLAVAGLLVGGAIGGYGLRALPFLPHVPLEWAGIALGAAGWLVERERRFRGREHERPFDEREGLISGRLRALAAGLTVGVLICAASFESFLVPHR
jgi:hypothetical protein